jgi:hypoxanthine phosphoribosyltransferase
MAKEINEHYKDSKNLVLLGVLIGGSIFMADLAREITVPCVIDFIRVSSYSGTESTGKVSYDAKPKTNLKGCDVLIV